MYRPCAHRGWTGVLVVFLLMALPACTSFKGMFHPEEDPKMAALQREMRQMTNANAATQKTIEDIFGRLDVLETRFDNLDETVEGLSNRPEPAPTVPDKEASSSEIVQKPQATEKAVTEPAPKKPTSKVVIKKAAVSPKRSPEREYEKALAAHTQHRYDEALALFKGFLQDYPEHHLADNAQYWIGEIYYDIENYPNAILAFKEVVTHYGDENKAPDALLKIGYAYLALDDPSNARIFLKRVIKNYPFSEAETKARAKLKELENL